jgi:hypothetical protein
MKRESLFKGIIVLVGTGLTYLKYNLNEHIDIDNIMIIIVVLITILLLSVYLLNKKVYGLKTISLNPKLVSIINRLKPSNLKDTINDKDNVINFKWIKEVITLKLILWLISALGFGYILGFYFKKPNAYMLNVALEQSSEWKKDMFIESLRSETTFFQTYLENNYNGYFVFNSLAFYLGIICVLFAYFIIEKTTFINTLKVKSKPYLK